MRRDGKVFVATDRLSPGPGRQLLKSTLRRGPDTLGDDDGPKNRLRAWRRHVSALWLTNAGGVLR